MPHAARAQVPEYPRPVPPIDTDEIPTCADTVVYLDPSDLNDEDRSAKRLRIEQYATAYLRGQPLFIATARLKGPFEPGWRNPWAQKKPRNGAIAVSKPPVAARPTHAHRKQRRAQASLPVTVGGLGYRSKPEESDVVPTTEKAPSATPSGLGHKPSAGAKRPNIRVEDWLKKNDSYRRTEFRAQTSLSSPLKDKTCRQRRNWDAPPISAISVDLEPPPEVQGMLAIASSVLEAPKRPTSAPTGSTGSPNGHKKRMLVTETENVKAPISSAAKDSLDPRPRLSLLDHSRSPHKPPVQIACAEKPLVDATADDEPTSSMMQSNPMPESLHTAPEVVLDPDAEATVVKQVPSGSLLSDVTSAQLVLQPPQRSGISNESSSAPILLEASHELPSAQIVPQPPLPSEMSNISSNAAMLDEASHKLPSAWPEASTSEVREMTDDMIRPVDPKKDELRLTNVDERPVSISSGPGDGTTSMAGAKTSAADDAGSKIAVPDLPGAKKRSAAQDKEWPVGPPHRGTSTKKAKRATFTKGDSTSDSSQGVLTSVMKVAKNAVVSHSRKSLSQAAVGSVLSNEDDENAHMPWLPPMSQVNTKGARPAPKGILKSSSRSSLGPVTSNHAAAATTTGTSSSSQQDAQLQRKLGLVEGEADMVEDNDFDLDAAIDDLGSFLGSWDADRAAKDLTQVSSA